MSIKSIIGKGRGGRFVNEGHCFFDRAITCIVIKMPHAEIPNESPERGIRKQTEPDGVILTLLNTISSVASVAMYDAVGDAEKDETGKLDFTTWNVWVESGIHRNPKAPSTIDKELTDLAERIQYVIREISPDDFDGYRFNTVNVKVGKHYNIT